MKIKRYLTCTSSIAVVAAVASVATGASAHLVYLPYHRGAKAPAPIMLAGIAIPFTSIGANVGMVSLPPVFFFWLLLTLLCYCTLTQLVKVLYLRRYRIWL